MTVPFRLTPGQKRGSPEFALCKAVARYLRLALPYSVPFSHFPAGEARDERTGAKLKAMGLQPGWADYIVILPGGRAAFIEIKAPGGRQSEHQKAFEAQVRAIGGLYMVCTSLPEVEGALRGWGVALRASAGSLFGRAAA